MSETTPSEATPAHDTNSITTNARNRARHDQLFSHGNYHNYYSFRAQQTPDPRLTLLAPYLSGATILDLGCNAGKLTKETITHFSAASALGLDLDPVLIAQATTSGPPVPNCTFRLADFTDATTPTSACAGHRRFDVVLLLSVTKWIHLNAGDVGLLALFREIYDSVIVDGGCLVVEPQDWANYKRAAKKAAHLREGLRGLVVRPPFVAELEEMGWRLERVVEREEGGFSRGLWIWRKGSAAGTGMTKGGRDGLEEARGANGGSEGQGGEGTG